MNETSFSNPFEVCLLVTYGLMHQTIVGMFILRRVYSSVKDMQIVSLDSWRFPVLHSNCSQEYDISGQVTQSMG